MEVIKMEKNNKNNNCDEICLEGVEYKKKIIEMVKHIENLDYLEFIYNMMIAFKKKWGI